MTKTPKDRETLSVVGRTCAGVGSALIAMFTMLLVGALGGSSERTGFRYVALIVSGIFVVTEIICCANVKENAPTEMKTATVKEMFSALFRNDQAMVVVATIVLINSALGRLEGQLHPVLHRRRRCPDPGHDGPVPIAP